MIKQSNLNEQVYERVKALILGGVLQPGQKIKQESLAEKLGVSRMPLHKAFEKLEAEFLVESIPRRGIFVKVIEPSLIIDAFEMREGIEGVAVRRAARSISQRQVQALRSLFQPFVGVQGIDEVAYQKADFKFHNMLLKICGNSLITRLEILNNIMNKALSYGLVRPPEETLPEHFAIIDALERHDGSEAEHLVKLHTRKSRDLLAERLESAQQL